MPRYIKPFAPKPVPQPSDNPNVDPTFKLDGTELQMFDQFAQEPVNAGGTEIDLWLYNIKKTNLDPLYSEPNQWGFDGPYVITAHIEWPEFTLDVTEEGLRALWPGGAWIPRKTLDDIGVRGPRVGDIIRFWDLPYFNKLADLNKDIPGAGYFFDIIKVNDDGHLFDNAAFVGFRLDLKRRTSATPEQEFNSSHKADEPCPR